jgi:hypothetical protein
MLLQRAATMLIRFEVTGVEAVPTITQQELGRRS